MQLPVARNQKHDPLDNLKIMDTYCFASWTQLKADIAQGKKNIEDGTARPSLNSIQVNQQQWAYLRQHHVLRYVSFWPFEETPSTGCVPRR